MMRKRNILFCSLTGLMCLVSLFLPGTVLALKDLSLSRSTESVAVDEVQLSLLTQLDNVGKLRLAGDSLAASIPLEAGRVLTGDEAVKCAIRAQQAMGIYLGDERSSSVSPRLTISDGGESMVLWDVSLIWPDSGFTGRYLIDDETGALLGIELSLKLTEEFTASEDEGELTTEKEAFQDMINAFLAPLGLDYAASYIGDDRSLAQVLVVSESGEADLTVIRRNTTDTWLYSINMRPAARSTPAPAAGQ